MLPNTTLNLGAAVNSFISRFAASIYGVLSGFDRVRFRGTQRLLANVLGMGRFLAFEGVLLRDFKPYVTSVTDRIRREVEDGAAAAGRKVIYLNDAQVSKEELAEEEAKRAGVTRGLRAIFSAVEPCRTFFVRKNPTTGLLELQNRPGKCLHYYHYWQDDVLGPCHVRLQSWFPFNVFVCVNGRDMLAGELDRLGLRYRKRDNCFSWVEDVASVQRLLDAQVKRDWSKALNGLLTASHPGWSGWPGMDRPPYWSAEQTEWATDVMFKSVGELSRLMPRLVHLGLTGLGCSSVLRFLGRPVPADGRAHANFQGEVGTDYVKRPEGVRMAFRVNRNQVKFYDKQASVLRVETTISDARDLKSYRASESDPEGPKSWRRMKKGVSDLPRRAQVSQKSNDRCLEALAGVAMDQTLGELTVGVCRRQVWLGRGVRALNLLAEPDLRLLRAVGRGEFLVNGLRNRDLRALIFNREAKTEAEAKQQSAAVTRMLRLLRAHGVIRKVSQTHRYQVTETGRELINGLTTAYDANPKKLQAAA
jgi:hypothetical protein